MDNIKNLENKLYKKPFTGDSSCVEESFVLSEMLNCNNNSVKLEAFKRLTAHLHDQEEPCEIYSFIENFRGNDFDETNEFLNILTDFMLTTSHSLRNRIDKISKSKRIMENLLVLQSRNMTEYAALLILNILSFSCNNFDRTIFISITEGLNFSSEENYKAEA
jgi:hypothetical protein